MSYFPNGAIKQFTYGNGLTHTLTQNARQLPDTSCDAYGACGTGAVLNDGYDYDGNANVAAISDGVGTSGGRGNRTMTYDGLDRLQSTVSPMFATSGPGTASYAHDVLDNLTRVTVPATALAPARDHYYCYDAAWRLTNVKTGGCGGTSVIGLGYDAQGNLANKNGVLYAFDYGNRLRSATNGSTVSSYVYDGHGRRVRDYTGQSKYGFYSQSGQLAFTRDDRQSKFTNYIYLGGSLVATREWPLAGGTIVAKYQHTDALGTPVAVTGASRTVLERSEYEPYGKLLSRPLTDGPGFTGHVQDAATGLTYMQQRYYDPAIGRFLSVDPVTASSVTGANFNRYWYAANNPYRFIDPDGREACGKDTTCRISSGMSAGTINGAIASANGSTFNSNGSVRTDRSATAAQRNAVSSITYRQAKTGSSNMENWIFMDDGGNVLGKTQQGCTGDDSCSLPVDLLPTGTTLAGHTHIYTAAPGGRRLSEAAKLAREFPGKSDGQVLALGLVGAAFMPSGARYLIEGNPPRAVYMGGGDSAFGQYVSSTWRAGMTDAAIMQAAREYLNSQR